jgi:7-cyano-7-deazaguanine synthase
MSLTAKPGVCYGHSAFPAGLARLPCLSAHPFKGEERPLVKNTVKLLIGGGIDSAALIPFYQSRSAVLHAVHFDYGQPSASAERRAVRAICRHYRMPLDTQKLGIPLPSEHGEYRGRNGLLLIAAAGLNPVPSAVAIGIHAGTSYYDCSPAFLRDINRLFDGYFGGMLSVEAPFVDFDKRDVCGFAREVDVPLALTFSCERTSRAPCGECLSCRDRDACLERP